jgi:hypothetical protein
VKRTVVIQKGAFSRVDLLREVNRLVSRDPTAT